MLTLLGYLGQLTISGKPYQGWIISVRVVLGYQLCTSTFCASNLAKEVGTHSGLKEALLWNSPICQCFNGWHAVDDSYFFFDMNSYVNAVAILRDSSCIVSGSNDNMVQVWDALKGASANFDF